MARFGRSFPVPHRTPQIQVLLEKNALIVTVRPPAGAGTGVGANPTPTVNATPPAATGAGVGVAPTIFDISGATPFSAAGAGVGVAPTFHIVVFPKAATGLGAGVTPTLLGPLAPVRVKAQRGWHFVLVNPDGSAIGELTEASSKSVTWPLNDVASATFTMPGTHAQAALIGETITDLLVYDPAGKKRFRGRMGSSSDAISAAGHQSTFSAVDYRGYMSRRLVRDSVTDTFDNVDQAEIAWTLINDSQNQIGADPLITRGSGQSTGVLRVILSAVRQDLRHGGPTRHHGRRL